MDESVVLGGWYGGKPRSAFFPRRWRGRARCVKGDAVAPGPDVTVKSQSSEWCLHSGDKKSGGEPAGPAGTLGRGRDEREKSTSMREMASSPNPLATLNQFTTPLYLTPVFASSFGSFDSSLDSAAGASGLLTSSAPGVSSAVATSSAMF